MSLGLVLPSDSLSSINERIRYGDATVGWRGDPNMAVYATGDGFDTSGDPPMAKVVGQDGQGNRYIVTSVDLRNPGWKHELLAKLRDGDWQRPDLVDRVMDVMEKPQLEAAARLDEQQAERAEHLAWALRKDLGHLHGGLTKGIH